jgi:hypothetical protein
VPCETSIGRFLRRLANDDSVTLQQVAVEARVPVAKLNQCREGLARLAPEEQMRVAAVVVSLAPAHARVAHALYAQAQTELRFIAREVGSHGDYDVRNAARMSGARAVSLSKS